MQLPLRALVRKHPVLTAVTASVTVCLLWYAVLTPSLSHFWLSEAAVGRPELVELVTAVGRRRAVEPRLSGNFAYEEFRVTPSRSGEAAPDEAPLGLRVAAIALEKRAHESTDPVALNAFGIAQLVTGQTAGALSTLEEANRLAPKDARLSSDLAAGYLVRSRDLNRIEDAAHAVGLAQRAIEADPTLAEARFNLALSLEALSLRLQASTAWRSYLTVDSGSPWAREARQRLQRLAESPEARWETLHREIIAAADRGNPNEIRTIAQQRPDAVYEYVENDVISAWADAWLARDTKKANKYAQLARTFGGALADSVGERLPLEAAAAIEHACANQERADALARAHRLFSEGRALYEQDRVAESVDQFTRARTDFLVAQSPFSGWATLQLAIAQYYRSDFESATESLTLLDRDASDNSYLRLLGRVRWMTGLIHYVKGRVSNSLDSYRDALKAFERAGAVVDQATMHINIAENLEAVGDLSTAWTHDGQALAMLYAMKVPRRREFVLGSCAKLARRANLLDAAILLQTEVIADAESAGRPVAIVQGYLDRADANQVGGQLEHARRDIESAERWLERISDQALARRYRTEIMLAKGQTLQTTDPRRAIDTLQATYQYFRDNRMDLRLPRVNLALGRAQVSAGQPAAAEASFLEGIRALEAQRATLPSGQLRLGYFDQPWSVFDEMISLQAGPLGKVSDALMYAERFRSRDLAETAAGASGTSILDPARLTTALTPGTAVIYYVSLDERLLVWVIQPHRVDFTQQDLQPSTLAREVVSYTTAVERRDGKEIDRIGSRLYEDLIRPLLPFIKAETTLVIIPDGALNRLPFASLKDQRTGRYLVEDHPVGVAPSATMFAQASARLRRGPRAPKKDLLVLANPRLDSIDAGTLPDLTGAEDEARDLASLYPGATILTGQRATKRTFLETAAEYRIVHFAGHAVANEEYSLLSRLLLARSGPDESGSLFAHEIMQLKLATTDLVVLGGCRTGFGAIKKGEGVISLARPFLAVGVPSVIATLWDVSDDASRELFAKFYQSLRQGADPAVALRDAQLQLLRGTNVALQSPAAWAGFISLGGVHSNGGQHE